MPLFRIPAHIGMSLTELGQFYDEFESAHEERIIDVLRNKVDEMGQGYLSD